MKQEPFFYSRLLTALMAFILLSTPLAITQSLGYHNNLLSVNTVLADNKDDDKDKNDDKDDNKDKDEIDNNDDNNNNTNSITTVPTVPQQPPTPVIDEQAINQHNQMLGSLSKLVELVQQKPTTTTVPPPPEECNCTEPVPPNNTGLNQVLILDKIASNSSIGEIDNESYLKEYN